MQTAEYLKTFCETMPSWLAKLRPGAKPTIKDFLGSRIVFYPGCGHDGQPVALFGSSHAAHCFVYADYGVTQNEIESDLNSQIASFRGYRTLARFKLQENDITLNGWAPHVTPVEISNPSFSKGFVAPFGFIEILERIGNLDDSHGPERLAILFLGADGIATYDALFCQSNTTPPFAIVIQEHGFGGNYDSFGKEGLLALVAKRAKTFPEFLLVSKNSDAWDGYAEVPDLTPTRGGEHNMERALFKRYP